MFEMVSCLLFGLVLENWFGMVFIKLVEAVQRLVERRFFLWLIGEWFSC